MHAADLQLAIAASVFALVAKMGGVPPRLPSVVESLPAQESVLLRRLPPKPHAVVWLPTHVLLVASLRRLATASAKAASLAARANHSPAAQGTSSWAQGEIHRDGRIGSSWNRWLPRGRIAGSAP